QIIPLQLFWQIYSIFQLLHHIIYKSLQNLGSLKTFLILGDLQVSIQADTIQIIFQGQIMNGMGFTAIFKCFKHILSTCLCYFQLWVRSMLLESHFFQHVYFNNCQIYCNSASISCFIIVFWVSLSIAPPVAEDVEVFEPEDLNSRCSACKFSLETSSAHWLSASQLEYSIF